MAEVKPVTAVFPGTFDPFTRGHFSLVMRGIKTFNKVIVAVAGSTSKNCKFSLEERVDMAKRIFEHHPQVEVESFSGLLVHYVEKSPANVIMRGLRAVSDFEYEFQMALMNRRLDNEIQTVFLMTDYKWMYLSSTIIKDVAVNGGDIKGLVPRQIYDEVIERLTSSGK
ncbi:pantetheine-phosphate adenylyltransferase [Maridesulfovibrio zosterae]|uniref:pantetheine-phosphate adenylyltransferase n=1 Tax=Maridesulfovibrio zosterae TaxID=82171 RepID=UPI000413048D|nr:pantetheine-phosphate adenylyltransferase [Maridesulfovibrio zosterae]